MQGESKNTSPCGDIRVYCRFYIHKWSSATIYAGTCGTYCRHKALYCSQRQNVLILTPNSQAKGATRTLTQIVAGDRASLIAKNATG